MQDRQLRLAQRPPSTVASVPLEVVLTRNSSTVPADVECFMVTSGGLSNLYLSAKILGTTGSGTWSITLPWMVEFYLGEVDQVFGMMGQAGSAAGGSFARMHSGVISNVSALAACAVGDVLTVNGVLLVPPQIVVVAPEPVIPDIPDIPDPPDPTPPVDPDPTNVPPTAAFTHSETDLTTSVNGSTSSDTDGTIASYQWLWGDSTTPGTGSTASHTYAAAGTYTVILTVTDDDGATGSVAQSVTVTAPTGPPPSSGYGTTTYGSGTYGA